MLCKYASTHRRPEETNEKCSCNDVAEDWKSNNLALNEATDIVHIKACICHNAEMHDSNFDDDDDISYQMPPEAWLSG